MRLGILFEDADRVAETFTSKDADQILAADQQILQSQLTACKTRGIAMRRARKSCQLGEKEFASAYDNIKSISQMVAQRLASMTSVEYVEILWKTLDKTEHHEQIYSLLGEELQKSVSIHVGRKPHDNSKIKNAVMAHYKVQHTNSMYLDESVTGMYALLWCPVFADFRAQKGTGHNKGLRKLSHIIPVALGNANLCALLGYDPDMQALNSVKNCIYLHSTVEKALDRGDITFVPVSSKEPVDYRLIVVNVDLLKEHAANDVPWSSLADRVLQFRNDNRPSKRHVNLHNVLTYMKARVAKLFDADRLQEKLFGIEAYATPDAFLRSDMLRWLSESVAGNLPNDWSKHSFENSSPESYQPSVAYLCRRAADFSRRLQHAIESNPQPIHLEEEDLKFTEEDLDEGEEDLW